MNKYCLGNGLLLACSSIVEAATRSLKVPDDKTVCNQLASEDFSLFFPVKTNIRFNRLSKYTKLIP